VTLDWSPQQEQALSDIEAWLRRPPTMGEQVRKLFGYAGTGKSTLAQEINAMVGGAALACAYTGKAASVMAKKGLPGASTVHSLIYTPVGDGKKRVAELEEELRLLEKVEDKSIGLAKRLTAVRRSLDEARSNSGPQFVLKEESEVSYAPLVILDECSMVGERMAEDLLSFGVRLLVLGDPAQLHPVRGTGYFIQGEPHNMLTEVHRQARDNPIIDIATRVREGRRVELGDYGATRVVTRVEAEDAIAHDQVLCGTNRKRQAINARHRVIDGRRGAYPNAGERLICLKNDRQLGLLNGTIWNAVEDVREPDTDDEQFFLRIEPEEGGEPMGVPAEVSLFHDDMVKPDWRSRGQHFTYGYAVTVHKAQGSQWEQVLLFDDWPSPETHRNWLYTGVTRAAERLTLVRSA
jgi:exodeoxyribonuclease-5